MCDKVRTIYIARTRGLAPKGIFLDEWTHMPQQDDVPEEALSRWKAASDRVTDIIKVYTRPFVNILAGGEAGRYTRFGTGTFIERDSIEIITCQHVACFEPTAYFLDGQGSLQLEPGNWLVDAAEDKDIAIAPISDEEWQNLATRARPLPYSKFAQQHTAVDRELIFFRGIAGENVDYVGNFGVDAVLSGYCSQEELNTGDSELFEMLWNPEGVQITTGTDEAVRDRVKYTIPGGLSGSLVWNTKFVEFGCDFERWRPQEAVVTGLLRRFDPNSNTLLVWRIEHVHEWLRSISSD